MEHTNYTLIYRRMHWAIAVCMTFMLLTIFLRLTWMNKDNVADIIQNYLSGTSTQLSRDQLIVLAKQIRQPMWDWHIYFGYLLVGLYSLRMAMPFFGQMKFTNPFDKRLRSKVKFKYAVHLLFYGFVGISLITGLIIELGPASIKGVTETIHKLSIYYLLAFIFLHFGGVLFAELTNQQGIISGMVSGNTKPKTKDRGRPDSFTTKKHLPSQKKIASGG